MSRLSILLPCRDAAAHLPDAIASIEAQTCRDYEVLAIDDGSTDDTGNLLDSWAARDRRVRCLRTAPLGLVHALQTGLQAASGEIVARMDADDIAHPDRLARQVELLDREPAVSVCATLIRYFPRSAIRDGARRYERWINSLLDHERIVRDMFVECPIPHPAMMVRRRALEDAGGYRDAGWPEDYDLVLRLWAAGRRFAKVDAVLLDWRESAGRLSRTSDRYSENAFRRCKAHWLKRTLLAGRESVVVWGAGPVGKAMARQLSGDGIGIEAFVDLDPRKIGQQIHGAPVVEPAGIHSFAGTFVLAAVAGQRARTEIRQALDAAGRSELEDYCAVA